MKKKIYYLLIFFYLSIYQSFALENKIIYKINNEIVTSYDLKLEEKYLGILNTNLKKIDNLQLKKIAKDSILKEKIKEIELNKYYSLKNSLEDPNLKKIIKNLYNSLGINDEKVFLEYLKKQDLDYEYIKKKISIEMLWNNLIFRKFNNQVVINENGLIKQIENEIKMMTNKRQLLLSEILINNKKNLNISKIYKEIISSSNEIGFDNTANIYSKSESAKMGGKIGWIEETSLSPNILKSLINLNKGQISKPIKISDNFIIIKIDDVKFNKKEIDKNKVLNNKINFEKNQQLERFSIAYFNRVKQNITINEL